MDNYFSITDLHFQQFEELADIAQGWSLDFRPLKRGNYVSDLQQIITPHLIFSRCHISGSVDQRGSSTKGYRTFAVMAPKSSDTFWCGQDVGQQDIMIFPDIGEFTATSQAGFHVYTFGIEQKLLTDMTDSLYHQDWFSLIDTERQVIGCEPADIQNLRMLLNTLSSLGKGWTDNTAAGDDAWSELHVEQQLIAQLLKCIIGGDKKSQKVRPQKKQKALNRAIEYIQNHQQEIVTAYDLSKIAGVSQRTLEYAFKEHYDLSPKAFINCSRLHSVNKRLYHEKDTGLKINHIASQHGFWHMGQFAADYKKLFGELPSETYRDGS